MRDGLGPCPLRLTTRSAWIDHTGNPFIEGTLIRLEDSYFPGGNGPPPVLLSSATGLAGEDVDAR